MRTSEIPQLRRPPAVFYKYLFNPLFSLVLSSPLHGVMSSRLAVLRFRGRNSGTLYRIPVGYVQQDYTVYITSESRWTRNLHGRVPATLRLRGTLCRGRADVIDQIPALVEAYTVMLRDSPMLAQIVGLRQEADGQPVYEDVVAAHGRGFVVVKIELEGEMS